MEEDSATLLATLLGSVIKRQLNKDIVEWLEQQGASVRQNKPASLNISFGAVPRKTGRSIIEIQAAESAEINRLYPGFSVANWTLDKCCRLWLLLQADASEQVSYHERIEQLFRDAEMNELAALYACLPVFAYPESWQFRATEGIRSNIGPVLEAVMYENPYPYQYLPDPSWNQMVLKAFFTEKDVNRIMGLDQRANKALASILIDYAHERQAAHRLVNPHLWRLVSRFIDESSIQDIRDLFNDPHITVRRAAVLACNSSSYEPARQLLHQEPAIWEAVIKNELNWESI